MRVTGLDGVVQDGIRYVLWHGDFTMAPLESWYDKSGLIAVLDVEIWDMADRTNISSKKRLE